MANAGQRNWRQNFPHKRDSCDETLPRRSVLGQLVCHGMHVRHVSNDGRGASRAAVAPHVAYYRDYAVPRIWCTNALARDPHERRRD